MQKQMNGLWFRLLTLEYRLKMNSVAVLCALKDVGIEPGMSVLDFGCGIGRYSLSAAEAVGSHGVVYAVDVHPLAIKMVEKKAAKARLENIHAVRSDCATGLAAESVDIVLLYDALHDVEDKRAVLRELHRVLRPRGDIVVQRSHLERGTASLDNAVQRLYPARGETDSDHIQKVLTGKAK